MERIHVLFVCVHNSARSQMAEAFLNALAGKEYAGSSAGLEPGILDPLAVEAMKEVGIDISHKETKSVFDLYRRGEVYSYAITVCSTHAAERCPIFPGLLTKTINWNIEDPASFAGAEKERLEKMREVRDIIKTKIESFLRDVEQKRL